MSRVTADLAEIRRAISALAEPGGVVEVRVPKTERSGTISGYFDDPEALVRAIATCDGAGPGVYMTLNPVRPELLARAANRLQYHAHVTTADHDILRRAFLLIDIDPVRPTGISASDAEHAAALGRMAEVAFVLNEEGWPLPIRSDSGNGAHLIYPINLPNDPESTTLVKSVLESLAERFDDQIVKVDRAVFNPSRITKAYGTWARKGDDTADRPHRLARLLHVPGEMVPVPRYLLEEIAKDGRKPGPPIAVEDSRSGGPFDVEAFLSRYLKARPAVPYEGGKKWILETCPFNADHRAPDAAIFQRADGSLGFRCLHDSCSDKHWRDVRELYEGPRTRSAQPANGNAPQSVAPAATPKVVTASEVYRADYPDPVALVDPILYAGLTILAGRPKIGKSWLALQLALALVLGIKLAKYLSVPRRCKVLYLSLEERARQTRSRLRQLLVPDDPQSATDVSLLDGLRLMYDMPTALMAGGAAVLDRELQQHPVDVVIVDSLLAIVQQANRKGQDILQTDYNIIRTLREIAEKHGIPLVLVAHTRKAAGDLVDTVQGTSGTTAAADAVWGLARGTDGTVTLEVTGRDLQHNAFAMERRGAAWMITGEGDAVVQGEERREILALLGDEGPKSPSALARSLRKNVGAVQRLVGKLCEQGLVTRTTRGTYQIHKAPALSIVHQNRGLFKEAQDDD